MTVVDPVGSGQQALPHPMQPEPDQVGHRCQPHDLPERVLEGALADAGHPAEVGHRDVLADLRQGVLARRWRRCRCAPAACGRRASGSSGSATPSTGRSVSNNSTWAARRSLFAVVEDLRLPGGRRRQPLAPVEQPASAVRIGLQRLDAAAAGGTRARVGGRPGARGRPRATSRNVTLSHPASTTNRASVSGAAASIKPGLTGSPFTVPCALRAERDVGEQPLVDAGAWSARGGWSSVSMTVAPSSRTMHPPRPKRLGLQLHRVLVDQLDARVHGRGLGDLDHGDRRRRGEARDPSASCGNPIDGRRTDPSLR